MSKMFLDELLQELFRASAQASVLVLVVLALRRILGRSLTPQWRCVLWFLVVARLAWPFSLPSPVSVFNLLAIPLSSLPSHGTAAQSIAWVVGLWTTVSRSAWVSQLWVAGCLLLLGRVVVGWMALAWKLRDAKAVESWEVWWLLQECKDTLGFRRKVKIVESVDVASPFVTGFFAPMLVLPRGTSRILTRDELRDVFLHELAHLQRSDIPLTWIFEVVKVLHWFNPAVWFVCRQMNRDREEACDEVALERSAQSRPHAYGATLVKLLEGVRRGSIDVVPGVAGFFGREDPLVHRLRFILGFRRGSRSWVVGGCTSAALLIVGFTDPINPLPVETVDGGNPQRWAPAMAALPHPPVDVSPMPEPGGSTADSPAP